ncbi:unnamed protein product [Withania somnifera]
MGSSENADSGKVAGSKSQFSQTCNLLSQFLKKKGSFGDLNNLGIYRSTFEPTGSQQTSVTTTTTTTMNLLPMIEKSGDSSSSTSSSVETKPQKPMDLFPQDFDFCKEQSSKSKLTTQSDQPEKAQMTIFYGGQVIVFDDFPADKAKQIMKLANKQNPTNNFSYNTMMMNNQELPKCNQMPIAQTSVADLPIARRNSLTRFLEKRRDRITATAPYQICNKKALAKSKNDENKAWLGLGAQFVKTEQQF